MSTRIVFDNGLKLTVAADRADVVEARRRDVTLKGRTGRPLRVNWDHVVSIQPLTRRPTSAI